MKLVIICNNHNSLTLLNLAYQMAVRLSDVKLEIIFEDRFLLAVKKNTEKFPVGDVRLYTPLLVETHTDGVRAAIKKRKFKILALDRPLASSKKIINSLKHYFPETTLGSILLEALISVRLFKAKQKALQFLESVAPAAILTVSDRSHDYLESSLLWAAHKRKIKIIIPYVAHYDKDYALSYRRDQNGKLQAGLDPFSPWCLYKLLSYFRFKKQLYKGAFFQTPYVLAAHFWAGTMSSYPWWVGNGNSDLVCVNSLSTMKIFKKNMVPKTKLVVVGDVNYDILYENFSQKALITSNIIKKYKLDQKKKIIIFALPQFAEQGLLGEEQHTKSINKMMSELCDLGCNVLVSLHPRVVSENYTYLENQYPCKIVEERLAEVLISADIFVSHVSSTVIWATICGIKAIVFDHLMLNEDFYTEFKTINVVNRFEDIGYAVRSGFKDKDTCFESDWYRLSRTETFDGNTVNRYIELIERS